MFLQNKLFVSFFIVIGLLAATCLYDIQGSISQAASITGIVSDENGDPIEDAHITIVTKDTNENNMEETVSTDSNGAYEIVNLRKGRYTFIVKSPGFETMTEALKISKSSSEVEKDFTLIFSLYTKTNDTKAMDSAVTSFKEIGVLRRQVPIDGDSLAAVYRGELQALTKEVDAENDLTLDSDIAGALDDIKNNTAPDLAAQVINKTLQRIFYLAILKRTTDVLDDFHRKERADLMFLWDEAYAAYQAIVGTADRENKVLSKDHTAIETGSNPNLEDQILVAFIRGQKALNMENHDEGEIVIGMQRQVISISLTRAFYIAVIRETGDVLNNRESNLARALENQKEGEMYYRAIEAFVLQDNPEGNKTVKSQLTGDLADVDANIVIRELSKGFIGRVRSELESNESAINADNRGRAIITAEEALHYSKIFMEDLKIRLGTKDNEEMEDALHALKDASNMVDNANADAARQTISTILDNYESELL